MNTSQPHRLHPATHLFTLRLWVETFGDGQGEVRMQVKYILSGETRYFRDWGLLLTYLQTQMQEVESESELKGDNRTTNP